MAAGASSNSVGESVSLEVHRFEGDGVGLAVLDVHWSLMREGEQVGGRTVRIE
ncbi:MAG: hypothetical protein FJ207_10295 [Gemmatimonadetes bacterium]|nr:hypothetical protein [Gemmatimonadota bacterium]